MERDWQNKRDYAGERRSQYFKVKSPNAYEEAETAHKTVMITVLEVLYDNKLCALVYMRDITNITHFIANPSHV